MKSLEVSPGVKVNVTGSNLKSLGSVVGRGGDGRRRGGEGTGGGEEGRGWEERRGGDGRRGGEGMGGEEGRGVVLCKTQEPSKCSALTTCSQVGGCNYDIVREGCIVACMP